MKSLREPLGEGRIYDYNLFVGAEATDQAIEVLSIWKRINEFSRGVRPAATQLAVEAELRKAAGCQLNLAAETSALPHSPLKAVFTWLSTRVRKDALLLRHSRGVCRIGGLGSRCRLHKPSAPRIGGEMFRYRLHSPDGADLGEATYALMIKPGEEILLGAGRRYTVLDVVPFEDEDDQSPFVGMLQVEAA